MKILFISHDASRSGAPLLLLDLIRLLNESGLYECAVLLKNGGVLTADFEKVANTFIWNIPESKLATRTLLQRISCRFSSKLVESNRKKEILNKVRESSVIINNTITNGELLKIITTGYSGLVLSYIHELKMSSFRFSTNHGINLTILLSHRFITPSHAVKLYLENDYKVSAQHIFVLNSYVPENKWPLESELYCTKNKFIIGGCGTIDWGKGIDIYISVARYLLSLNLHKNFSFIWKGGNVNSIEYERCFHDIQKSGLNDIITLLPADANMASFYKHIDIFFLSSREDSYPLVVLEAASFGKPIICFENAGGAPEFIQDDAGSIVPYLDIISLLNVLLEYQQNPKLVFQKGSIAKNRMILLHQNKSLILEQFKQLLKTDVNVHN